MRLTVAVAVLVGMTAAQVSLGPNGTSTPPVNVVPLFRLAQAIISHMMSSSSTEVEGKEISLQDSEINDVSEKAEAKCPSGEKCWPGLERQGGVQEGNQTENRMVTTTETTTSLTENRTVTTMETMIDQIGNRILITTDPTVSIYVLLTRFLAFKWMIAYTVFIIASVIIILIIGIPYLLTGQSFRSYNPSFLPLPDQQDSLLLLAWLLGETSGDVSCLERVVCLTPERSDQYLSIPRVLTAYFSRWVPTHYQEQVRHLDSVTEDGLHNSCEQYRCPVLPDL